METELGTVLGRLEAARRRVNRQPAETRLRQLDRWAQAWDDPASETWRLLEQRLGAPVPAIRQSLRVLTRSARLDRLKTLIQEQIGPAAALDSFAVRPYGGKRLARGYPLVAAFLSGGAALSSWPIFLLSLVAGSAVFARMSEADMVWPGILRDSLALVDPDLADCIALDQWPADDEARHSRLCRAADLVIAHGSDSTMEKLRRLIPGSTPFLPFGSRLSFALIAAGAVRSQAAQDLASDIVIYDQNGCLSPQIVLIEGGEDQGREFAALLAAILDVKTQALSPVRTPAQQAAIREARELAAFQPGATVFGPADLRWTVLFESEGPLTPSPAGCTVRVRTFCSNDEVLQLLETVAGVLQAVGLAAGSPEAALALAIRLADLGVTRVCPLGMLQRPTLGWSHDGRALLSAMTRFVDFEE
jgi:hypothetical protein